MLDEPNMMVLGVIGIFGILIIGLMALRKSAELKSMDTWPVSPEEIDSVMFAIRKSSGSASKNRIAQFAQGYPKRLDYLLIRMKQLGYIEEKECCQGGLKEIIYSLINIDDGSAPVIHSCSSTDKGPAL